MNIGDTVDRYEVVRVLGEGGMAAVYLVRHHVLGSLHALKILRPALVADDDIRERFLGEGRIQAQLRHPNILPVTDVVVAPGVAGLVMQYVDGPTLEHWIDAHDGPVPAATIRALFLPILGAVGEAHAHGVVHRDLKPANILLEPRRDGSMRPLVADFGIAKIAEDARLKHDKRGRTGTAVRMGTLAYMSPEQILHAADVDRRSDIFSLGAILHELATGSPAFDGPTEYAIMHGIVQGEAAPIPDTVDPRIAACVRRALMRAPEERFPDCDTFAAYLADPTDITRPTDRPSPRPDRHPDRVAPDPVVPVTEAPIAVDPPTPPPRPPAPAATVSLPPIPAAAGRRRRRATPWLWVLAIVGVPTVACLGAVAWKWPALELYWATHVAHTPAELMRSVWTAPHGIRLRYVPAGDVLMGSPPTESGRDRDEVRYTAQLSRPVLMMETEVTQGQWRAVMKSDPNRTRTRFWDGRAGGPCSDIGVGDALPVTCVDWYDAVAFANALSRVEGLDPAYTIRGQDVTVDLAASGYRLPTEAEWARAATYGRVGRYGTTDRDDELCQWANVAGVATRMQDRAPHPPVPCDDGFVGPAPVGSFRPNPLGLYDLIGNAWEWTWDVYDGAPRAGRTVTDPTGPRRGPQRVLRGGSWYNHADILRVANRYAQPPEGRSAMVGFRLVRTFRPADAANGRPL